MREDGVPTDAQVELSRLLRTLLPQIEEARARPVEELNRAGAFEPYDLNLGATGNDPDVKFTTTKGGNLGMGGFGLIYLRRGSNPGGLLELTVGGKLQSFGPGDVYRGPFTDLNLKRAAGSATTGYARLLVLRHPLADYKENLDNAQQPQPITLLGTVNDDGSPATFVTVTEDTDPTGANPTGSFDATGFEYLRVLMDTRSGGTDATTFDVVFWFTPVVGGTTWFECGYDGRYSIPDVDAGAAGRYRSFIVPWRGRGQGAVAVRNLLAAARTSVGFIIQGIK